MKVTAKKLVGQAYDDADKLRNLVSKRIGVSPDQIWCPREKSEMTPCVVRDGALAVAELNGVPAICVGCENNVAALLQQELDK
jgi:hypothetical protein